MTKNIKINNRIYTIIAIFTFLIMALGATFAYFSTGVNAKDAISVGSIDIRMNLNIVPIYNGVYLVPTNDSDIDLAYQKECIDDIGNGACLAYKIEIKNIGDEQEILANFKIDNPELVNLKYKVLDAQNENINYKEATNATIIGTPLADSFNLASGGKKEMILIIWLSNLTTKQDEEQGQTFKGTVSVNSSSGAKLTGTISMSN